LDFSTAIQIANNLQQASTEVSTMQSSSVPELNMNKFDNFSVMMCYRCNGQGHRANDCFFKNFQCHTCGKIGHLKRACKNRTGNLRQGSSTRQNRQRSSLPINNLPTEDSEKVSNTNTTDCINLHSFVDRNQPLCITLTVNNKPVRMELDTGSALSIMSYNVFKQTFKHERLQKSDVILKTYTGEKVSPVGMCNVTATHNNQSFNVDLYVLNSNGPTLLGREWLHLMCLNLNEFNCVDVKETESGGSHETNDVADEDCILKNNYVDSVILNRDVLCYDKVCNLMQKHHEVFDDTIGCLKNIKGTLNLQENATPKFCKARSIPHSLKSKVEAELKNLEREGIIRLVSWSEWATPIVPVIKKSGAVRICGDFKVTINPQIRVEQYPLPKIEDIFANLAGGRHFSKIDLKQAYLQMTMDEKSQNLLVINTHKGLFQYTRLPFGVASAPALWQRAIEQVLQGLPGVQCLLDDIIVTGRNEQDHLNHLDAVFQRLSDYGLRVNKNKCELFQNRIEYCGHEIDKEGLHKTKAKIDAMLKCKRPTNVTELRSFLGLVNYYHRFLPNLATTLQPVYDLLKSGAIFKWNNQCEKAFEKVKQDLVSDNVLAHYDLNLPLKLACDASSTGLGAVLSHVMPNGDERPIAFASRTLNKAERNYSQIDKEALAIIWAVKSFTHIFTLGILP